MGATGRGSTYRQRNAVRTKPTTSGYEAMAMIRKGQVRNIGGCDIKAQGRSIATMFEVAA
jgi:hypothetical protein